ncbi:translation initiation factor IF-2-like [Leopardus geoffroyi]|uniref:translation initiation factor IF-2-like n=1 Tax=Leopardus geoffroyi TaxID=46844 RepID=UPI001E264A9D|nr:translation initiation factor IF-2-like [Leopardus geoffroyi]
MRHSPVALSVAPAPHPPGTARGRGVQLPQLRRQAPPRWEGAVPLRPAWPHPALPRAPGGGTGAWRGQGLPAPGLPHCRPPRLGPAQTLGRISGPGRARARARARPLLRLGDRREGGAAARLESARAAEPGVRPRAAAASSESRTRKEETIEAHRGERSCPAAGDPGPRPSPAVRCEQGLGVPVGIGEPNRGGVSPAASPGSVGKCKRAGGTFTSTEAERGARVSACVREIHTHQEKVSDLNVSATNSS